MELLLWILATLSLIGGVILGIDEEEIVWVASGLVSFALLGGFAVVITILKEMSNQLYSVKDVLAKIAEEQSHIQKNLISTNKGHSESIGEKLLEEQRRKEEEEKKRIEEQRRKEEERKRQEEQRKKAEEQRLSAEKQRNQQIEKVIKKSRERQSSDQASWICKKCGRTNKYFVIKCACGTNKEDSD